MSKVTLPQSPVEKWQDERAEWIGAVERLMADVEAWATKRGWWVHREDKIVSDDDQRIGTYQAPMLRIQTPTARFILEPIARYVVGADGRVDLAVFPSYHSAVIVRRDGGWQMLSDRADRAGRARRWSEDAFVKTIKLLTSNA